VTLDQPFPLHLLTQFSDSYPGKSFETGEHEHPRVCWVYEEPALITFVFRFPNLVAANAAPVSLKYLLPSKQGDWGAQEPLSFAADAPIRQPALSTRFSMARSLSQSVGLLLACGILYKQLTSNNIVFFCTNEGDSGTSVRRDLTRPFITGFVLARPPGSRYFSMQISRIRGHFAHAPGV
jgi:hypothetical protein